MFALLGFVAVLLLGCVMTFAGLFAIYAANAFGSVHKGDRVVGWVALAIGVAICCAAFYGGPISINLK